MLVSLGKGPCGQGFDREVEILVSCDKDFQVGDATSHTKETGRANMGVGSHDMWLACYLRDTSR